MDKGCQNMTKIHKDKVGERIITYVHRYRSRTYTKVGLNPSMAIMRNGDKCQHSLA